MNPEALGAVAAIGADYTPPSIALPSAQLDGPTFGEMLSRGLAQVEQKVDAANELVRAFVVDNSIPIHQVTVALEEARLSVELALHVRARLVEGYRELMNMQL